MKNREKGWNLGYDVFSRYRGVLMGFAMVSVLLYHAFYITPVTLVGKGFKGLGFLGVDIFIFLSALGLSLSWNRRQQSYGTYLKRRLVRVLPLYWLVTGLYGLCLRLAGQVSLKTVLWTMSTLFYWFGKPSYFNWYIPGLLFFYLLAPACTILLTRFRYRGCLVAVLSVLVFPLFHFAEFHHLGHLVDVIGRIPVFLIGILAGVYIGQGRKLTPIRLCLWALLPLLIPVIPHLTKPYYLPKTLAFAFGCVAVCLLLSALAAILPKICDRALELLGKCSLEIYLLNVVFVMEYGRLSAFVPLGPNHYLYYAITIPGNILLGVGLHYALEKPLGWLTAKITR